MGINYETYDDLKKLIERHRNEEVFYKSYEFDEISYTLMLNDIIKLLKENQGLKKQLEEKQNPLKGIFAQVNDDMLLRSCGAMQSEIDEYKTQQQEFIEYLEEKIHAIETTYSQINGNYGLMNEKLETLKEILQKYKEIIGVQNESR